MTEEKHPAVGETEIAEILSLLSGSGWKDVYVRNGDFELRLSDSALDIKPTVREENPPAVREENRPAAPAPGAVTTGAELNSDRVFEVTARSIGVFWRSPQPGAPSFVEVGDVVEPDSPLAIVEVMKMMTRVTAGVAGRVAKIHVDNGDMVESGQKLITVERSGV